MIAILVFSGILGLAFAAFRKTAPRFFTKPGPKALKPHRVPANPTYGLKPGFAWNPLRNYPRNAPCYCGSGRKAKSCHLPRVSPVCLVQDEDQLRLLVDRCKELNPDDWKIVSELRTLPKDSE